MRNAIGATLGILFATLAGPGSDPAGAGCSQPITIAHFSPGTGGAFILPERSGQFNGPELRFWMFGQYLAANNGSQGQFDKDGPWLLGAGSGKIPGVPPDHFWLYQVNWQGPRVVGCPMDAPAESRRTVVEVSYLAEENRNSHYTGYLIASVAFVPSFDFNFDNIADGNAGGARVKMVPIPVPVPVGVAVENRLNNAFMDVNLQIPDAKSYGDSGAPNLIAGYEIFYKNDTVPVSSDPGHYEAVRNPDAPTTELGVRPHGIGSLRVSVKRPKSASYFAMRIRYVDNTTAIFSRGTSAHSDGVAPPEGANANKEGTPSPTPTPPPVEEPTPTPEPVDPEAAGTDVNGGARGRNTSAEADTAAASTPAPAGASTPVAAPPGAATTSQSVTLSGSSSGGGRVGSAPSPAGGSAATAATPRAGGAARPFSGASLPESSSAGAPASGSMVGAAGDASAAPPRSGDEVQVATVQAIGGSNGPPPAMGGAGSGSGDANGGGGATASAPEAGELAADGRGAQPDAGLAEGSGGGAPAVTSAGGAASDSAGLGLWRLLDVTVLVSLIALAAICLLGRGN